jgi:hypothetical protein
MDRAYRLGANVYLAKQVNLTRLVALLNGMITYARAVALEPA